MSIEEDKKDNLVPAYQKMMKRVEKTQKQSTTRTLQQHIEYIGMRFFYFVQKHNRIGFTANTFG